MIGRGTMDYGIGIDLGGTEIKAVAHALSDGEVLGRATAPARDGEFRDGMPGFLVEARRLVDGFEAELACGAKAVGVSAPGLAATDGRSIANMPGRLEGLVGLDWGDGLGRPDAVPILNDAHAALLGEIWLGAAHGLSDVIMLTLGTGVGGAAVSGGRLLTGHLGRAGHLGHISIDYEGQPDICATPGSLEDAVGNATLQKRCGGAYRTTHELVAAYARGEPSAVEVWERSLRALAAGVVSLINAFDPQAVVIGGGIATAGEHLFDPLRQLVREREWRPTGKSVDLRPAELGAFAGAAGAVYNAASLGE